MYIPVWLLIVGAIVVFIVGAMSGEQEQKDKFDKGDYYDEGDDE